MIKKIGVFLACGLLLIPLASQAASPSMKAKLNGKILLQVQSRGEAWYVNPTDGKRYFLGSPEMAIGVFSRVGLGITNSQLLKIPLGFNASGGLFGVPMGREIDNDGDSIPDEYEAALGTQPSLADSDNDGFNDFDEIRAGYDPMMSGARLPVSDKTLANRLKGRIMLQVESRGQAWYINPADGRRYYLGTPERALAGMRFFGLGITNADITQLQEGPGAIASSPDLVDCGMSDIENEAAMQACFGPQFRTCSPAKVRTEVNLAPLIEGIIGYEYEIIGPRADGCEVKSRYTSNPNPEYLNKNLFCRYDNRKPFNDAVQEVFPALTTCSGELKPYLTSR